MVAFVPRAGCPEHPSPTIPIGCFRSVGVRSPDGESKMPCTAIHQATQACSGFLSEARAPGYTNGLEESTAALRFRTRIRRHFPELAPVSVQICAAGQ